MQLVPIGDDVYHPSSISREIATLAPQATLIERWKQPELVAQTAQQLRTFLRAHTPRSPA